jgi:hypothetical protein
VTKNRFDFAQQQKLLNNYPLRTNFLSKLENTIKNSRRRALEDDDEMKKRII